MPWELRFFDGLKGKVGVLPVTLGQEESFKGEEYLNLYPFVDFALANGDNVKKLWVNNSDTEYARLDLWANGNEKIRKHG